MRRIRPRLHSRPARGSTSGELIRSQYGVRLNEQHSRLHLALIPTTAVALLTHRDLQRLVRLGYLQGVTQEMQAFIGSQRRANTPPAPAAPCLILTDAGAALVCSTLKQLATKTALAIRRPHWDAVRRELRIDGLIVRRFERASTNQELLLSAFERQEWPERVDDPLPDEPYCDPKQRLHDTIKRLNRSLLPGLIRFSGDGSGTGVLWRFSSTGCKETSPGNP